MPREDLANPTLTNRAYTMRICFNEAAAAMPRMIECKTALSVLGARNGRFNEAAAAMPRMIRAGP